MLVLSSHPTSVPDGTSFSPFLPSTGCGAVCTQSKVLASVEVPAFLFCPFSSLNLLKTFTPLPTLLPTCQHLGSPQHKQQLHLLRQTCSGAPWHTCGAPSEGPSAQQPSVHCPFCCLQLESLWAEAVLAQVYCLRGTLQRPSLICHLRGAELDMCLDLLRGQPQDQLEPSEVICYFD